MPDITTLLTDQDTGSGTSDYDLYVTKDKVRVNLTCADPLADLPAVVARVSQGFIDLELPAYPDPEHLTQILQAVAKPGENLVDQTIIMGADPRQPVDGRLEWARDFFAEGWAVDPDTGNIDFWEKVERRAVEKDELLARLYPPVPGEPGLSVYNNKIPVDKPLKVRLGSAKSVRQVEHEDGVIEYYADCNGRVRYADGTVAVDDVYVIKGDVSLETGNITHTGTLMVEGDIQMGAKVHADGDIIVKGMLEPCDVYCGGSLTVSGGIVGDEEHLIEVGGEVQAKYIGEARMRVLGNVTVANEISHGNISCRGCVQVPRGRIAGGRTVARKGIRISEAGASGSADTVLIAGVDFTLPDLLRPHEEKLRQLTEAEKTLTTALERAPKQRKGLPPEELQKLAALQQKARATTQAIAEVRQTMKAVTGKALRNAVEEIQIYAELWTGTTLQIGDYKTTVKVSVMKPRRVQRHRSRIKILPMGEGSADEDTEE